MRYFLFIFLIYSIPVVSQHEELKKSALRDAKIAAKATLNENYELLVKYTFPEVVAIMGGEEKAVKTIEASMEGMKKQGFVFEKAEVINVSDIIKEQGQYRCYVQNNNVMTMSGMRIRSKSFLLGAYDEVKKIWYFIEAEKLKNKTMVDKVLPDFTTSLKIPKDEMTTEKIE